MEDNNFSAVLMLNRVVRSCLVQSLERGKTCTVLGGTRFSSCYLFEEGEVLVNNFCVIRSVGQNQKKKKQKEQRSN